MNTSIGFHTFTISIRIDGKEAKMLLRDFHSYRDKTQEIKMYTPTGINDWEDAIIKGKHGAPKMIKRVKRCIRVDYISDDDRGINWFLRYNTHSEEYKEYIVEARVNPKRLAGISDYITAADNRYIEIVEKQFNNRASKISPILRNFSHYNLKRIDYCINFDLREMGIKCTPEQMIKLIKMGDYPSHFKEYLIYDKTSKRKKSGKYSFYLKSKSVNINCYYKYRQLKKEDPEHPSLNDSLHVIRFEVQCKYHKTYSMSKNMIKKRRENFVVNHGSTLEEFVSDITSENIIDKYFNQIIKPGDYYTLKEAIQIIESHDLRPGAEQVLTDTLKEINRKGIAKTRTEMNEAGIKLFYQTLRKLADMGINPVTIPKSFGLKHIPNLLETFKKMRESGEVSAYSNVDPFDTIDRPFEESNSQEDNEDLLEPFDEDSESEYEETIIFGWERE